MNQPRLWMVAALLAGAHNLVGSAAHVWTGGSTTSGNWSTSANWYNNSLPSRDGTEALAFDATSSRFQTTNNLAPSPPAAYDTYGYLNFLGGSYTLWGNPLKVGTIVADYGAGANTTIRLDLIGGLTVVTYNNNSTLTLAGDLVLTNGFLRLEKSGDVVITGVISGNQGVEKALGNNGDLIFSGNWANTYTGVTTVRAGVLRLNRYRTFPNFTVGMTAVPGDLRIGSGTTGPASDVVVLDHSHQIANTATVEVFGSGQFYLSGHNEVIASLEMTGGSVVSGAGTLTVQSNVTVSAAADASIISGNLELTAAGEHLFSIGTAARLNIPAVVSGAETETMLKEGEGELVLSGVNAHAGPIVLVAGTLSLMTPQALGSTAQGTTLCGGALRLEGVSMGNEALTVDGEASLLNQGSFNQWQGDIVLNSNLTVVVSNANTLALAGRITGSGGITKLQGGTLELTGDAANTYSGLTLVSWGNLLLAKTAGRSAVGGDVQIGNGTGDLESDVVMLGASEQIADSSAVEVTRSGLLDLRDYNETVSSLTGIGAVDLRAGSLTVSNVADHAFEGSIRGGSAGTASTVTKRGSGVWTLQASHTYYQKTVVREGTLALNGSLSHSTIEVYPDGTLAGKGTVQGVTFSGSGGRLSPGTSAGRLIAQKEVVLQGGTLVAELNGVDAVTGYDQLVTDVAPNLTDGHLSVLPGFVPPAGGSFLILNNRSVNPVIGTFIGLTEGAKFAAGGQHFQITYFGGDGNDVVLTRVLVTPPTLLMPMLSGNQLLLRAQGSAGTAYVLEAAPHLTPPIPWQPIGTNTANLAGVVEFQETDLPWQRFYRVTSP